MTKREEIEAQFNSNWDNPIDNEYNYTCPICYCLVYGYSRFMHIQWHLDLFDSINKYEVIESGDTKIIIHKSNTPDK